MGESTTRGWSRFRARFFGPMSSTRVGAARSFLIALLLGIVLAFPDASSLSGAPPVHGGPVRQGAGVALGQASHRGPGLASYDDPGGGLSVDPGTALDQPADQPTDAVTAPVVPQAAVPVADVPGAPTPSPTPALASRPVAKPAAPPRSAAPGTPRRLRIPSIGVDTTVESVGLAPGGGMGIPSNPFVVAWYSPGPRPGDVGNAVIDGHLDHPGGPGVFWNLGRLRSGDKILVQTDDGQWKTFVVTFSAEYPYDHAPVDLIFGPSLSANLNLITCEGVFNHAQHNYDRRRVVYARLQK